MGCVWRGKETSALAGRGRGEARVEQEGRQREHAAEQLENKQTSIPIEQLPAASYTPGGLPPNKPITSPHLPQAGSCNGPAVKAAEEGGGGCPQLPLNDRLRLVSAEGGHAVLSSVQGRGGDKEERWWAESTSVRVFQERGCSSLQGAVSVCACGPPSLSTPSCPSYQGSPATHTPHTPTFALTHSLTCSLLSSSVNSAGNKSLRVEKSCSRGRRGGRGGRGASARRGRGASEGWH